MREHPVTGAFSHDHAAQDAVVEAAPAE